MFNRLPPELVRQIIESATPSPSLKTYNARQSDLQAFCLVCKYLRDIAQPLLFEFVMASNSPRTIKQALIATKSKGWTRCIREVLIYRDGSLGTITSRFKRLAENGGGLRVLTLAHLEESVDVSLLRYIPRQYLHTLPQRSVMSDALVSHAELQQVRFFGRSFKISSRFVLPRLESLTIGHTSACVLAPMLNSTALPALRSLAMPDTHKDNFKELRRSGIADLSEQLDAMFLSAPVPNLYCTYDHTDYFPAATLPCTLFDSWEFSKYPHRLLPIPRWHPTVYHLRIRDQPGAEELEVLVTRIEQDDSGLKSLYLSPEWHHQASPLVLENLMKACQAKSIDVIYEVQDVGWTSSYMSEEFCRRQRELRRLEAAQTVEVEE